MKAYVLHGIGDLRLEEVHTPVIKQNEVLVKVMAAGICGSDIPRIYRTGAHRHPLIPGHEFAGQVVQIGENVNTDWKGKRVGIFPLIPCMECAPCRNGQYEMCRNYNYLGSRCDGGFAEYAAVPESNLIALPDEVAYEEGAMLEPMAVAMHAMRRVDISPKDTVAVCGLGTIGLLLTMFLIEQGVKNLLVIGNKVFQKEQAIKLGIAEQCYFDCKSGDMENWISQHTNGNGVNVFFECVGRNETFSQAVEYAAPAGKVVLVGNPYADMQLDQNVYWKILRNQLQIVGTWNSSFTHEENDDWHQVIEKLRDRSVQPARLISHEFPLNQLEQGLLIMKNKSEDYIKIMAVMNNKQP